MSKKSYQGMAVFASLMLMGGGTAWAFGMPKVDLQEVCSNANVIVVGRIASVEVTDQTVRRTRMIAGGRDSLVEADDKMLTQAQYKQEYEFGLWRAVVTMDCLMGLAETLGRVNRDWATSIPIFRMNERPYLERWQTWWDSGGRLEFTAPPPR